MHAHYDETTREIIGFYSSDIHGGNIPSPVIEITKEQWQECLANPRKRRVNPDGDIITYDPDIDIKSLVNTKIKKISAAWEREIKEIGMPTGQGFNVDFGIMAQQAWKIMTAALPADHATAEVWDIENRPHTVTREQYFAIQAAQEGYYSQMLEKKWALWKAALSAETIEDLEAVAW